VAPVIGDVAAAVVGYLLGSVNPAVLIARTRGIDLRAIGSGNPGAANAGRALGRRTGVLVALLDVAKGAVPAALFGAGDHRWGLIAGLCAIAGHITSPWLKGRGGKGVATAAGAILGSHPLWLVFVLATWLLVLAASRWIALASMSAASAVLVTALIAGHDRVWAALITVVVVGRHTGNILRRLPQERKGT
jgi:glycerol-3-phosphate acyltransferase PlsY